jgi:hypothetical protein
MLDCDYLIGGGAAGCVPANPPSLDLIRDDEGAS